MTLPAFSGDEAQRIKIFLAAKVASMMGRKLEEGDWSEVYCKAKQIPTTSWSNLHIDINHKGRGVEFKMLRIKQLQGKPLRAVCGTRLMHPAATRSIRIPDVTLDADDVMVDVLNQYSALIQSRTQMVRDNSSDNSADMRFGWLLWEDELREFLYFEETMAMPNPDEYYAQWHVTPARGVRKSSKSLWIFERATNLKRYSVTTSSGIKIQPYFDVPPPNDPHLEYFCVQSEPLDEDTFVLWITATTAAKLKECLGSIEKDVVSKAVFEAAENIQEDVGFNYYEQPEVVQIQVSNAALSHLLDKWPGVNDDHRIQLLIKSMI